MTLSWAETTVSPLLEGTAEFTASGRQLVAGPAAEGLAAHQFRYGGRPRLDPADLDWLIEAVSEAGLTGYGGAHFPVAAKWQAAQARSMAGLIVVANGAEGEPLSAKDHALLQLRPHLVLDGLACAAEALGAQAAVVWITQDSAAVRDAALRAVQERSLAGVDRIPVHVLQGPGRYLTGESSAVVHALEAGRFLPRFTRVPAAQHGVHGRPTVIHNVETLARLALIARGAQPQALPGPLVTIADGGRLRVRQLAAGMPVAEAVLSGMHRSGGAQPQAVLVGGAGGSWLDWTQARQLRLGDLDGRPAPAPVTRRRARDTAPLIRPALSTGVLAMIRQDACGLAETAALAGFLARSSAKQCGPCRFGTQALTETLWRIARSRSRAGDAERLRRLCAEVDGRGACGLPDGAAQLVRSALTVFARDLETHRRHRGCGSAGGARALYVPVAQE